MKKILSLFVLLVLSLQFSASAGVLRGDVNGTGSVNMSDLTSLIGYLLSNDATGIDLGGADSNLDGNINVADVTSLIDYLLTGSWPEAAHEWVDLGLPSGTLWAICNIGATSPEDYGDYFAWGETEPKEVYSWATYKWCNGATYNTLTKYCPNSDYGANGFVDNKTELDPTDDAAYVNWGPSWRMPTMGQQEELCEECTWQWTTLNGVNGYMITGSNGKTIFMPAAGYRWNDSLDDAGSYGCYWSRTLYSSSPYYAYSLYFDSGYVYWFYDYRNSGFPVRAVRVQ